MTFSQALFYLPAWCSGGLTFFLGACIGSFLNVVIYRIPIGPGKRALGERFNINTPGSHCPLCKHRLAWYENIPLVSWLVQARKCKSCKAIIPARYPAVELLVAGAGLLTWWSTDEWAWTAAALVVSMALLPAAWWVVTRRHWNRFMLTWIFSMSLASMMAGGYAWTVN